jgi:endoglucanase
MSTQNSFSRRAFLQSAATAASVLLLPRLPSLAADRSAVPPGRLARLATGANICRWFRYPRVETAAHFGDYLGDAEAAFIAELGLKHVRLCVAPKIIMDAATGEPLAGRLPFLEAAIARLQRAGLLVVVDIHNEDREAELNPDWQAAFVKFWSALAGLLTKFDPELTILELINEPVFAGREHEWPPFSERLVAAIRAVAPAHTILTSGPNWGGIDGLLKLRPLADRNMVYSFHCYDPFPFTHQGATWAGEAVKPLRAVPYPSSPEAVDPLLADLEAHPDSKGMLFNYGHERWNKKRLAARFQQGVAWGARHGVPLYCGEFGVFPRVAKPEHRANWFRDFGEVLREHRIGWAVWGWDEGFGLNRRLENGKPVVDPVVAQALGLRAG